MQCVPMVSAVGSLPSPSVGLNMTWGQQSRLSFSRQYSMEITIPKYFWRGVSPKGTVFLGSLHASKQSKTIERWKTRFH